MPVHVRFEYFIFGHRTKRFYGRSVSQEDLRNPDTITCYTHLKCKYGGSELSCLDWREVCDGKVDCPDGGSDEEHCFELEMNECEENEYRCQNGQCVAHEFFRDGNLNPDCLDRTDEATQVDKYRMFYHDRCASDPSFRCEEHTCQISGLDPAPYSCGDAQCSRCRSCSNKRNLLILKFDGYVERNDLCWIVMACLTRFLDVEMEALYEQWCRSMTRNAKQKIVREECPPVFDFPTDFIMLGHVRLFYTNNLTVRSLMHVLPTYICYQQALCPLLPFTERLQTTANESLTCRHLKESVAAHTIQGWLGLVGAIQRYFWPCSNSVTIVNAEKNISTLFSCPNSNKYISKHRLVDGVRDCGGGEDESYNNSCALGSNYRLEDSPDGRCLVPTLINKLPSDCFDQSYTGSEVDSEPQNRISFQTLCDRFIDISPMMINGREQSDETDCEHWDCDNTYTHNDGIWNCPNGQDELPSPPSFTCPLSEHFCISPITYNLSCLPIDKVNNGQVDCIGGTDERNICQIKEPEAPNHRFLCSYDTIVCANIQWVCNNDLDCPRGDDEFFCQRRVRDLCSTISRDKRSLSEELLCQLGEKNRVTVQYFGLRSFPDYPQSTSSNKRLPFEHPTYALSAIAQPMSHSVPSTWPSRWRCHRGLNIRDHDQFKCVCPPSYYGDSMPTSESTYQSHAANPYHRRDTSDLRLPSRSR